MKKMNQWIALLLGLMLLFSCSIASASITPLPLDSDVGGAHPWKKENRLGEDKLEYKDESIHVKVEKFRHNGLRYIVAYVDIVDPSQIRTAASYGTYDDHRYVKTQIIAKSVNSIVCVNGDFFKYNDFGYLIRQGQLLRERPSGEHDVLMIDNMGDFHTVKTATEESAQALEDELTASGRFVVNSFTFGPTLVLDGEKQTFDRWMWQADEKAQRIAIAQVDELTYMIFQCDGATKPKKGMTLDTFADMMLSRCDHIRVAYNMDGGGSANVIFGGKKLNSNRDVRQICDILYFATIETSAQSDASGDEP